MRNEVAHGIMYDILFVGLAILLISIGFVVADCAKWMRNAGFTRKLLVIIIGTALVAAGFCVLFAICGIRL